MALSPNGSTRLTLLPTSYLANLPPDTEVTLDSLVQAQERLADEAKEAMPYAFDECSYEKGYLRQSVWSCIDCGEIGVCYGCSISCHSEHKLVELWTRRHFRCDCPTDFPSTSSSSKLVKRSKCTLTPPSLEPRPANTENKYNQNYKGEFCRCGRPYDPETEKEGMLCCIGCEDWFHESCLNLRPPKPSTAPSPAAEPPAAAAPQTDPSEPSAADATNGGDAEDEEDEYDEDGALIRSDTYDGLVCGACVASSSLLTQRAGTLGYMTVVAAEDGTLFVRGREALSGSSAEVGDLAATKVAEDQAPAPEATSTDDVSTSATVLGKRSAGEAFVGPDGKRPRLEGVAVAGSSKGEGDIFLADGTREALLKELSPEDQAKLPFPLVDEEMYEPPTDAEPEETLEEVTERVVGSMPRVNAIEALHGYARIRDGLRAMLQSHAQEGRVVSREDIESMFEGIRGAAR